MVVNQINTLEIKMKLFAKKHLKKLLVGTLALTLIMGLTGCGRTPEEKATRFADRVSDKLALNDDQRILLDSLKDNALQVSLELKSNKQLMQTGFIELISLNSIEETEMLQFTDQNIALLHAGIKSIVPHFVAFHASLDDEQKQKVITFITKHKHD
jgi:hypothetical protein